MGILKLMDTTIPKIRAHTQNVSWIKRNSGDLYIKIK